MMPTVVQDNNANSSSASFAPGEATIKEDESSPSTVSISTGDATTTTTTVTIDNNEIPLELQLDVVDMNDENMDMLEWLVRRWIPIPKQYYWDIEGFDPTTTLNRKTKLWHDAVGTASATIKWIERRGTPIIVEATGLTNSRIDYVTSQMTPEQWETSQQLAHERREASKRRMYNDDDDDAVMGLEKA